MYEHAIEYCDMALQISSDYKNVKYRKAKSLAYLFQFDESVEIFKEIGCVNEINLVGKFRAQSEGIYDVVI